MIDTVASRIIFFCCQPCHGWAARCHKINIVYVLLALRIYRGIFLHRLYFMNFNDSYFTIATRPSYPSGNNDLWATNLPVCRIFGDDYAANFNHECNFIICYSFNDICMCGRTLIIVILISLLSTAAKHVIV